MVIALLLSSTLIGLAVLLVCQTLMNLEAIKKSNSLVEAERRSSLRSSSSSYRRNETLIDEWSEFVEQMAGDSTLEKMEKDLTICYPSSQWLPTEFISTQFVNGLFVALGVGVTIWFLPVKLPAQPIIAALFALMVFLLTPWLIISQLADTAKSKKKKFKLRLPYAIELIALMMGAGASFEKSLVTAIKENDDSPIKEEFGSLLRSIRLGMAEELAFEDLASRMQDTDVDELVLAINTGMRLGTPMDTVFMRQAELMRMKRTQWGEKMAAEANVKMTFPTMLIVGACMLVILAPFAADFIQAMGEATK